MRAWHLVVLILVVGGFWLTRPPSAARIARGMEIDLASDRISYREDLFTAQWGTLETRRGTVRHVVRAHDRQVPVVLYHLVLATGEYSDPEIVTIDYTGGGNYVWRAGKQPAGSLIVLHLVPESEIAFRTASAIEKGDEIEIVGRDELRGTIERDDGAWLKLGHTNHKFVLVSRVQKIRR